LAKSNVSGEMLRADDWFRQLGQGQAGQCIGDNSIAGDHAAGVGEPRLTPA
jgi:hypothetical protein